MPSPSRDDDLALMRQVAEALYGPVWQTHFARALGVSRRATLSWAQGQYAPQPRHWAAIAELVEQRRAELAQIAQKIRAKK